MPEEVHGDCLHQLYSTQAILVDCHFWWHPFPLVSASQFQLRCRSFFSSCSDVTEVLLDFHSGPNHSFELLNIYLSDYYEIDVLMKGSFLALINVGTIGKTTLVFTFLALAFHHDHYYSIFSRFGGLY